MLPTTRNARSTRPAARWSLLPDIDYLFDDFVGRTSAGWTGWNPSADLYENDEAYVLEMELPGFGREDIELTVERNVLSVSGQRSVEEEREDVTFHLRERGITRFSRSFALPRAMDGDAVEARFDNGVLTVTLPKAAEARPKRIEVRGA